MFRARAHRQEGKIVLYSLWYRHTCRWPSRAGTATYSQAYKPVLSLYPVMSPNTCCCNTLLTNVDYKKLRPVTTIQLARLQTGEVNSTTNLFSGPKYIQYANLHDLVI